MKRWEYAQVTYNRNHKHGEPCINSQNTAMSKIDISLGLYVDRFLTAAGEQGWELAATLLPYPVGKELSTGGDNEDDISYTVVKDPLDIQWLIFKREK